MYLVKNKKSPYYQVIYYVNGKRTTISTKEKEKREAEKYLETFKNAKKGIETEEKELTKQILQNITLSDFEKEYLEYVVPTKSKAYIRSIKLSFKQLESFLGNILLSKINVKALDQFITSTFSRTERGAHLYYRTLKAAFTKAVVWEYLSENPFKKIKFPKVAKSHPVFISVEEFKLICSAVEEQFLKDLFTVAFYTGMRLGEIVNMKSNWIDLNNKIITIRNGESFRTKSKKERIIPFNRNLKNIFEKYIGKEDEYIFTRIEQIKLREDFVTKKFKKAVRSIGLNDKIHFHTLRHSFASMLIQKGVSLYVVKELLGHEDLSTTQIYSHLSTKNLYDAISMFK